MEEEEKSKLNFAKPQTSVTRKRKPNSESVKSVNKKTKMDKV